MAVDILLVTIITVFALFTIIGQNPIVSAFSLLMCLVSLGGVYYKLGSPFLAAVQILVYAGAMSILFIFVLMLLNLEELKQSLKRVNLKPIVGVLAMSLTLGMLAMIVYENSDYLSLDKMPLTKMNALFDRLFIQYAVPFEVATVLLFTAIVTSVFIMKRSKGEVGK